MSGADTVVRPVPPRGHTMTPARRIVAPAIALVAVVGVGTSGYLLLTGMSTLDALYMTIITLASVGYHEVEPLTSTGRIFTIALIVGGVSTTAYFVATVGNLIVEGRLREVLGRNTMRREIADLIDHTIVCGYGRLGKAVVDELRHRAAPFVVVDNDAAAGAELAALEIAHVAGSALADDTLDAAGLQRAKALVLAMPSDPDNVFITLSARERCPTIRIHARAETEAGARRLRLAGAHQVVSAYHMGGLRIAASILRPAVVDFLAVAGAEHGNEIDIEEIRVGATSVLAGRTVRDIENDHHQLRIVALRTRDDALTLVPGATHNVGAGDLLVAMGERPALDHLAQDAQG